MLRWRLVLDKKKDLFISKNLRDEYFKTWNTDENNQKRVCKKDREAVKKKNLNKNILSVGKLCIQL